MNRLLITNADVVLPDQILPQGEILIEDGIIQAINKSGQCGPFYQGIDQIDAHGAWLMPGFVDLHSDAIEKEIQPRPGAVFNPRIAFLELERKLAGQGITTIFHSLSFTVTADGLRDNDQAMEIINRLAEASQGNTLIRNRIHLRYEITNHSGVAVIRDLLEKRFIDLLSFMDHTPGQGQYPTLEDYRQYLQRTYNLQEKDVNKIFDFQHEGRVWVEKNIFKLSELAQALKIPIAAHDEDTPEKVLYYKGFGASISEFPITLETAEAAVNNGNYVCVGAPNVVRGGSTGKGLRASNAIKAGLANILCSDYYPPSLLHAVFHLVNEGLSLPEATSLVTCNPARAAGIKTGMLQEGYPGDCIIIARNHDLPVVTHTIVDGTLVYKSQYRSPSSRITLVGKL